MCSSDLRCGCFSVDREGTDTQSLKTAIDILQHRAEPLVIFPEGDVYHTNDRITSFREGAAAIAILAAKKSERPIAVLPTAIKRWYVEDPTPSILNTLNALEKKLAIAPNPGGNLVDRVLKVGDELLATKESEFLGERHYGALAERTANLAEFILRNAEVRYGIPQPKSILPERVKEVRRRVIQEQLTLQAQDPKKAASLKQDLDQMFLVTQLYSYPGDYILENPSIERIAETLDKLEEDFLDIPYPSVRGKRMVTIRFGTPIELPPGAHRPDRMEGSEESRKIRDRKYSPSELTEQMQYGVQMMIDQLNEEHRQNSHDAPRIS